jgi:hypothetical protein
MGKLTDDDLKVIAGKRDQLARNPGAIWHHESEAQKQIDNWNPEAPNYTNCIHTMEEHPTNGRLSAMRLLC